MSSPAGLVSQEPHLMQASSTSSLPPTLVDRIPGELHDRVIDHLHADPSALAVCSTVCRAWLRASRHHLLSTLEIRRQNAAAVHSLLNAPYSALGGSVRRLALRAGNVVRPDRFIGDPLPAVESLLLSASYLVLVKDLLSWTRCYTHQLLELALYSIKLDSLAEFLLGLHEFKVLRHLSLANGVIWADPSLPIVEDDEELGEALLPSLRSLILGGQSVDLIWWLLAHDVLSIARLDLRLPNSRRVTFDFPQPSLDLGQVYRAFGPNLRELDLYEDQQNTIDLSENVNLRALWFHDIVFSIGGWVNDLLARVTSPHVDTITLHVYSDDHGEIVSLDTFDWRAFTRLLSNAPFSAQLKTIRILWLGYYEDMVLTAEIYKKLDEHVPKTVKCVVADLISSGERTFGATTHGRLFDRHHNIYI